MVQSLKPKSPSDLHNICFNHSQSAEREYHLNSVFKKLLGLGAGDEIFGILMQRDSAVKVLPAMAPTILVI